MWTIPPAYANFFVPDRILVRIKDCSDSSLQFWRNEVQDKLESIQDGSYYQRDNFISGLNPVTWFNPNERLTKYYLDSGQNYALLHALDTELERRKTEQGT